MGTITKYYPFIDEASKSVLNSLMEDSDNYYAFVQRLCETVIDNKAPINLAYLAAVHAWWTRKLESMKLIREKYIDVPSIIPWGYPLTSAASDQVEYHDNVIESIEKAIAQSLERWMEIELHLLHTNFHWPLVGDMLSYLEPLEKAEKLLESNPSLKCFESLIYGFRGWSKSMETDFKDALNYYQKGKELTQVYNDPLYRYMILLNEAITVSASNIQEAIVIYEELYNLAQDLDVPYFIAEVLNDSSLSYEAAGEYDIAISCHLETIKIWGGGDTPCLLLSRIYSKLGDGQQALKWANKAFDFAGHLEFPQLYLYKAWASVLLDRLEEAQSNLDTAHSLILKSGHETRLGRYYLISGVLEFARGDYLASQDFLEKSQEIFERYPFGSNQTAALLELARLEIAFDKKSPDNKRSISPGKWLCKLEKFSEEKELLGVRMQAALLKSVFYEIHGQLKDASAVLVDALQITDSPGVNTLRKKIGTRLKEIEQLIQDGEMVS